jgi:acetylornithine/N-succinyldiaminopimelate aminotransferase
MYLEDMNQRALFLRHIAQTSEAPLAIEVERASGCYFWDKDGKQYLDLIAGISVCNIGHCHPQVVNAIKEQSEKYLHVMVYGEMIESPQVHYAKLITEHLPDPLDSVYFTNSGTEATEGAMKLAKRVTGRTQIISFQQSYHGSTQGALSVMGDEYWRNAYRPLLPDIDRLEYNNTEQLARITERTACVIAETVQAEKGVNAPLRSWIHEVKKRCEETGALLVLDEIQCGFGRTGHLWGFEAVEVMPDILLLGKALGGGMPLGAFIASRKRMIQLAHDPVLGHITTFGGHPVSCAAGMAAMKVLLEEKLTDTVHEKEKLFRSLLHHPKIRAVRSRGLLMAVEFDSYEQNKAIIDKCLEKGVFTDWFLFAPHCMRIAPPLNITDEQIKWACKVIVEALG